ncbi:MAG: suppressor of fused domain protein [Pirellulaceae bacterium]
MGATGSEDWEGVWDARLAAISEVLGVPENGVYHAVHPLLLGGQADVISFTKAMDGVAYVTADLTGKPDESCTDYELMICERQPSKWGPNLISRLAQYALSTYIDSGESMDIDAATPTTSKIKALVFDTYAVFSLYGHDLALRLCIGITKRELAFKIKHGSDALLEQLKKHSIYPFTDLNRDSIPLPNLPDDLSGEGN